MAEIEVLNPVALTQQFKVSPAQRLGDLTGKTVGLYWNTKAGGEVALAYISELLKKRFRDVRFNNYIGAHGAGARHMTAEQAERIARECQAVVASTAD